MYKRVSIKALLIIFVVAIVLQSCNYWLYSSYMKRPVKHKAMIARLRSRSTTVHESEQQTPAMTKERQGNVGTIVGSKASPLSPTVRGSGASAYNDDYIGIEQCPEIPPDLGPISRELSVDNLLDYLLYVEVSPGGSYKPSACKAIETLALIVPYTYQDNFQQLEAFLYLIHPFLMKQQLDYQIFVVSQKNTSEPTMGLGELMNIGFKEAKSRRKDFSCYIFHLSNLFPLDTRHLYRCRKTPWQMVGSIENFSGAEYNSESENLTKISKESELYGVLALTEHHVTKVNGFSNEFMSDREDFLEMYRRIASENLQLINSVGEESRYMRRDLRNPKVNNYEISPSCFMKLTQPTRVANEDDGLSSLKYQLVLSQLKSLYTLLTVDELDTDEA